MPEIDNTTIPEAEVVLVGEEVLLTRAERGIINVEAPCGIFLRVVLLFARELCNLKRREVLINGQRWYYIGRGDKMVEAFFQVVQVIRRAEVVYTRAAP